MAGASLHVLDEAVAEILVDGGVVRAAQPADVHVRRVRSHRPSDVVVAAIADPFLVGRSALPPGKAVLLACDHAVTGPRILHVSHVLADVVAPSVAEGTEGGSDADQEDFRRVEVPHDSKRLVNPVAPARHEDLAAVLQRRLDQSLHRGLESAGILVPRRVEDVAGHEHHDERPVHGIRELGGLVLGFVQVLQRGVGIDPAVLPRNVLGLVERQLLPLVEAGHVDGVHLAHVCRVVTGARRLSS